MRHCAGKKLNMLHLPGHDRFFHAFAFEKADHLGKLPDTDPKNVIRDLIDAGVRLLFYRDDGKGRTALAGALDN
jgi:hypothetical protein